MIPKLPRMEPANRIHEGDVSHGLRALLYEGVCSRVMDTLHSGAFLVAFALLLGASNTMVGLIAAISPLTQLLQIPGIYLVDRTASRKILVVLSSFMSRIVWLLIAVAPWIVSRDQGLFVVISCLFFYFGLGSISACGFNPWLRDFVPEKIMGRYFGKRLAISTAGAAIVAVLAGVGLEIGKCYSTNQFIPYSIVFILGGIAGLAGVYFLARVPEPKRVAQAPQGLFTALGAPFLDINFRRLLMFLGTWIFAINLSGPFYAVYMIVGLKLSVAVVVGLSVVSQVASVMSFRMWGRAADSFGNKSVLFVSGYMYLATVLLWPLLALSGTHILTIPLLAAIHVLTGISSAGLNLCTANIALMAAPRNRATGFLAVNTLVQGIAAATAPILGGIIADRLTTQQLSLIHWWPVHAAPISGSASFSLLGIHCIFVLTAFLGFYAIHCLHAVREDGEVKERMNISHLAAEAREAFGYIFSVTGLRTLHALGLRRYPENGSDPDAV